MANILDKGWLICFGYPWSNKYLYGGGHIILKFYENNKKILWINPIPNKSLKISSIISGNKTKVFKRLKIKIFQHIKIVKIIKKNFIVFSPIYLPFVENNLIIKINKFLLYLQVKILTLILQVKNPIISTMWANDTVAIIKSFNYSIWFHNAGDLFNDLRGISEKTKITLYEQEKKIFNNTDVIFAASIKIYEKIKKMVTNGKKVIYFPHGVDYEHFNNCKILADELKYIRKPIAGYFGSLTEANDQRVYIEIAKLGISVLLIGDILADYSECKKFNNIYFINAVPYMELPKYAKYFDVGILAWRQAEWIKNCNPKKTYEYLALGIPIVSVKIPQLEYELNDYITFVDSPSDFAKEVLRCIKNDTPELRNKRIQKAKTQSWDNKFNELIYFLKMYARDN